MRGKPYRAWIGGSLTVVVITTGGVMMGTSPRTRAHVYSVAEVKAGLARQPTAWTGRVVLTRGVIVTIHHSLFGAGLALSSVGPPQTTVLVPDIPTLPHTETALLSYIFNAQTDTVLLLRPQPTNATAIVAALGRISIVGKLLPQPRHVTSYTPSIYRLQLLAPQQSCLHNQCADAVLLDATP